MVDGGEPGVDSGDEGKHTGRNDLLFVEKMMWMGDCNSLSDHPASTDPELSCTCCCQSSQIQSHSTKDEERVLRGG